MRVLHIGKYYPPFAGGVENFMGDLLPALSSQGIEVAALVHDHSSGQLPRHEVLEEGVVIHRVPSHGRVLYAPVSPAFPFRFKRLLSTFQPDLLHFHLPNTSAFWAMGLPAARRLPWVVHWHSDVVPSRISRGLAVAYRAYRPFEQRLLARTRAIIATSPPYLETSAALAPWRERCEVIPLGLDPQRLPEPSEAAVRHAEMRWGASDARILTVGRLTYYKGHEYLIRAVAEVDGARLVIVGEGERRGQLEALIDALGVGDRVTLAGSLPAGELHAMLRTCRCLCLPSVERTEAFGVVLLEAMASAKPVVASDIPGSGVGWVVGHERTGLLVPPADAGALSGALGQLVEDSGAVHRMGEAAAARFQASFHIRRVAEAVGNLYERCLTGRLARAGRIE